MSRIHAGDAAPEFSLPDTQGKKHSLKDLLKKGPVIAAFFKMSCPTCQFTFPFLQRIHDAYGSAGAHWWRFRRRMRPILRSSARNMA
jgi:peroxiredoxin